MLLKGVSAPSGFKWYLDFSANPKISIMWFLAGTRIVLRKPYSGRILLFMAIWEKRCFNNPLDLDVRNKESMVKCLKKDEQRTRFQVIQSDLFYPLVRGSPATFKRVTFWLTIPKRSPAELSETFRTLLDFVLLQQESTIKDVFKKHQGFGEKQRFSRTSVRSFRIEAVVVMGANRPVKHGHCWYPKNQLGPSYSRVNEPV